MTRKHVTVSLSGDGADEVFGGYDAYQAWNLARFLPAAAIRLVRPLVNLLPPDDRKLSLSFKIRKFVDGFGPNVGRRHLDWMAAFDDDRRRLLLADRFMRSDALISPEPGSDLLSLQLSDIRNYLAEDILKKVDLASMLNSLEVRVPYLDYRLVPLVLNLPTRYKIRRLRTKWLLKRIAARYLPPGIVRRKNAALPSRLPAGSAKATSSVHTLPTAAALTTTCSTTQPSSVSSPTTSKEKPTTPAPSGWSSSSTAGITLPFAGNPPFPTACEYCRWMLN